jgi:hypothetical protein
LGGQAPTIQAQGRRNAHVSNTITIAHSRPPAFGVLLTVAIWAGAEHQWLFFGFLVFWFFGFLVFWFFGFVVCFVFVFSFRKETGCAYLASTGAYLPITLAMYFGVCAFNENGAAGAAPKRSAALEGQLSSLEVTLHFERDTLQKTYVAVV